MNIKQIVTEEVQNFAEADGFVDKRTPKEKVIGLLQGILNVGYRPYDLKTRGGGRSGISSAAAYQTKAIVDIIPQLSVAEIDDLNQMTYTNRHGKTFSFKPYIEHMQRLAGEKQVKADVKNIGQGGDQYGELVTQIKEKIEDFIVEQEQKIDADLKKRWEYIQNEHKTLSREDFTKKYGEKKYQKALYGQPAREYYTLSLFYSSQLGVLLHTSEARLPELIAKAQKAYRERNTIKSIN